VRGAKNLPLAELESRLPGEVKNKATPVILVCATGMRSRRAAAVAKKLGYEQAASLAGGLKAWADANLPVAKG
jgi:rhodanese-related sulfurtransferase